MRFPVPVALAVLALLATFAPAAGAAPPPGPGPPSADAYALGAVPSGTTQPSTQDNVTRADPATVVTVNLTPSGDARWAVTSRFRVPNASDKRAFRSYAESLNGSTVGEVGVSPSVFRRYASQAERAVNRSAEMAIEDARYTTRVVNDTASISLRFTWTDFAEPTAGDRVELGDVFGTQNGTWFPGLDEGQRLVINAPEGYGITDYGWQYPFDDGTIRIEGPERLALANRTVVFAPTVEPPPPSETTPTTEVPPAGAWGTIFGAAVIVAVVVAGAFLFVRRGRPDESGASADGGVSPEVDGHDPPETPAKEDGDRDPGVDARAETGMDTGAGAGPDTNTDTDGEFDSNDRIDGHVGSGADDEAAGSTTGVDDPGEEDVDEELLSDEERVERLLRRNGGRMKQANIVAETGWSNAKVSQLLSSMDEDNRIDKLRIGRENLISLPDEDVGEVG